MFYINDNVKIPDGRIGQVVTRYTMPDGVVYYRVLLSVDVLGLFYSEDLCEVKVEPDTKDTREVSVELLQRIDSICSLVSHRGYSHQTDLDELYSVALAVRERIHDNG